jgi:hypothetical protein
MGENGDQNYQLPAVREEFIDLRGDLSDAKIDFLARTWFRRVWVFLEVVASKDISIQCGDRRVGWDDFCKILLLSPRYYNRYGFGLRWDNKIETVRDCSMVSGSIRRYTGLEINYSRGIRRSITTKEEIWIFCILLKGEDDSGPWTLKVKGLRL